MSADADPRDLYARGSEWAFSKVPTDPERLDDDTPCAGWTVRTLLDHMLQTQRYFEGVALGNDAPPPSADPPPAISDDPPRDFLQARSDVLHAFGEEGVVEKTGPTLGIAFSDTLLHGWDLAVATGQDATMPEDLAEAAYETIHGRFTDEQRKGVFDPEIQVSPSVSAQEKLLAYTGREPREA